MSSQILQKGRIKRLISSTVFFLFFTITLVAQVTTWTGSNSSDWNDAANWSQGMPANGNNAIIPTNPIGGNFPEITGFLYVGYNITCYGSLTNHGYFLLGGTYIQSAVGTFDNYGLLNSWGNIDNKAPFSNSGTIQSSGSFMNNGTITNTGNIYNDGFFNNNGVVDNHATFSNRHAGSLNSQISFNNYASLYSEGSVNLNGGKFNNDGGVVYSGGSFGSNAEITNNGTLTMNGFFLNNVAGEMFNYGTLNVLGSAANSGSIENFGLIANNDNFTNDFSGSIANNGTVENRGCSVFNQFTSTALTGTVVNYGVIYEIGSSVNVVWGSGLVLTSLQDSPVPTVSCTDIEISFPLGGTYSINAYDVTSEISANYCYVASVNVTPSTFTCDDKGDNLVTVTVTDGMGFSTSCTANVRVECIAVNPLMALGQEDQVQQELAAAQEENIPLDLDWNANNENNNKLGLFPNPAASNFNIDLSSYQGKDVSVEITSMNGQKVFSNNLNNWEGSFYLVDASNFGNGLYSVLVIDDTGDFKTEKLIISGSNR